MPSVHFNNEASDECTLIDFVGEDRPGLLYDLTSAISNAGCNIELVLVDTEAENKRLLREKLALNRPS